MIARAPALEAAKRLRPTSTPCAPTASTVSVNAGAMVMTRVTAAGVDVSRVKLEIFRGYDDV